MATKRIKDITNTGSEDDLKSENFLALDGPNGSKKIPGDAFTPSGRTASISSSIAPEFDPDRAETYLAGSLVMHEGELREFTADHPTGPWISGDNKAASIASIVKYLVASKVIAVDYEDLTFPIAEGTQCFHDGGYFYANTDIATSEDWTAAHWTETSVAELSKQYLTNKTLVSLASNWEDVTSKVFNNNGVDATNSNFKFFLNRSLAMLKITGWAQFSSDSTSKRKCISFNTDLPGNQDTNLFSFTVVSKVSNSGFTNSGVCTTIFRPFAHSSFHDYDNGIYIDRPSISCNYVDSIFVVANIDHLLEEFCEYIDSH